MSETITAGELRAKIRAGEWTGPTSGAAKGFVQANLVILPQAQAFHFLLFCQRNPKPCPVLDVLEPGQTEPFIAKGADLRRDLPGYKIFRNGCFEKEVNEITSYYNDDMVGFLLGCSFSFENALVAAGVPVRNIDEGKNVSMYTTNIQCRSAGPFTAPLVVSMRPMRPHQAVRATQITTRFHQTHGAPIHFGDPGAIGIHDLARPDYGDAVTVNSDEIPVFWACGVTSTLAAVSTPLSLVITHTPGHMFVSNLKDEALALF